MPRTALALTVPDRTGTVALPALAAMDLANGNSVANNGRVMLEVKNSSAGPLTLTIPLPSSALPDTGPGAALTFANTGVQYTLAAGADIVFGPFPPAIYNQSDGTVFLNPAATTLQYRAIQLN